MKFPQSKNIKVPQTYFDFFSYFSILLCVTLFFLACDLYEETKISIDYPSPGQMIPADIPVEIRISNQGRSLDSILVDGMVTEGVKRDDANSLFIYKEPSNGLGFVSAQCPHDDYLVVRSWLQGLFVSSTDWYPESVNLKLGYKGLNEGTGSLSNLIKASLVNVELNQFIQPISVDLEITQAEIIIDSAIIKDMSLTLNVHDNQMTVDLVLSPLELEYRIENNLVRSQGVGVYDQVYLNAQAQLDPTGVTLVNPSLMSDPLRLSDEQLPNYIVNLIADALKDRLEATISQAILEVTHEVTAQLFAQFKPKLGILFQHPIDQEARISSVILQENSLLISSV